jgi:uncharacterized membrane protein YhfC
MVSKASIAFMLLTIVIVFAVPIGLTVFFYKRYKISLKAVLTGALIFFVFQILLSITFLGLSAKLGWIHDLAKNRTLLNIIIYAVFLSLTTGIIIETGRFLGFKLFLRNELAWRNGVAFGTGYSGFGAILIAGYGTFSHIMSSLLINSGKFDTMVAPKMQPAVVQNLKNMLLNNPPWMFALGGWEQILAVIIHIGFSLLVLYSVMTKNNRYLVYAILLHVITDTPTILYQKKFLPIWIYEILLFVIAVASLYWIVRSRSIFPKETENRVAPAQDKKN